MTQSGQPSRRGVLGLLGVAPLVVGVGLAAPGSVHATAPEGGGVPADLRPGGRFDRFVAEQAANDRFSGTVLLAHRGRPTLTRSYGYADRSRGIRNRTDTLFSTASMGKMFTSIAVAQLVLQGKMAYHATIGEYLDGFPAAIADTVTVHQMLIHTSGMYDYQFSEQWQHERETWQTPEESFEGTMTAIRGFAETARPPGTLYEYVNTGFYVLGAIVAKVTGQTFWDYVREHVLRPHGLPRTDYYTNPEWRARRDIAHAYADPGPDGSRADLTERAKGIGIGGGPGGAFTSAPELLTFARLLFDDELVSRAYRELITSGKYPLSDAERNPSQFFSGALFSAYGMDQSIIGEHRVTRRTGTSPGRGIAVSLSVYPDHDWVAILLSNYYVDILPYVELHDQLILGGQETGR